MVGFAIVLTVAAMLTGRPGTQLADNTVCPVVYGQKAYGCADIPGNVIHIRNDLMWMLPKLEQTQPYQAALAVLVFCHEARHVRGTTDERIAERWAVAHAVTVARLLGASRAWAERMRPWIRWWDRRVGS